MLGRASHARVFFCAILIFIFAHIVAAQDASERLRRVAENYHGLKSFEAEGHLTATIPGSELRIQVEAVDAAASHDFAPPGSAILRYGEARLFRRVNITEAQGKDASSAKDLPDIMMPSHWGAYDRIDTNVKSVRELPNETLELGGRRVDCTVVEVSYERETWSPDELAVRYWIDSKSLLVLKEDFAERQGRGSASRLWHWVYAVDSIKVNQPPPQWLIDVANRPPADHPRPEWVGRTAPNFSLSDLEGHIVNSSAMSGQVVVIDFWATWCGPCREELPIVEKISDDYKSQSVEVWGISLDERPSVVKKWMGDNHISFRSMIDPDAKIADQYGVEGIPAILVVSRSGKVISYYEGNQSEQSLRSAIDLALRESTTK